MPGRNDNGPDKYFGDRAGTEMAKYHVVPDVDGWALKREGDDEQLMVEGNKTDVVDKAKEMAEEYKTMVIVHDQDGRIEDQIEF